MSDESRCWWCDEVLPTQRRKFCSEAHRQKYKRATASEAWAELVQRLEPHIKVSGKFIYREMVDHLAGRVNERV